MMTCAEGRFDIVFSVMVIAVYLIVTVPFAAPLSVLFIIELTLLL